MVQTMTKEELIKLLEHSGRNIYMSEAFTAYNEDFIISYYIYNH